MDFNYNINLSNARISKYDYIKHKNNIINNNNNTNNKQVKKIEQFNKLSNINNINTIKDNNDLTINYKTYIPDKLTILDTAGNPIIYETEIEEYHREQLDIMKGKTNNIKHNNKEFENANTIEINYANYIIPNNSFYVLENINKGYIFKLYLKYELEKLDCINDSKNKYYNNYYRYIICYNVNNEFKQENQKIKDYLYFGFYCIDYSNKYCNIFTNILDAEIDIRLLCVNEHYDVQEIEILPKHFYLFKILKNKTNKSVFSYKCLKNIILKQILIIEVFINTNYLSYEENDINNVNKFKFKVNNKLNEINDNIDLKIFYINYIIYPLINVISCFYKFELELVNLVENKKYLIKSVKYIDYKYLFKCGDVYYTVNNIIDNKCVATIKVLNNTKLSLGSHKFDISFDSKENISSITTFDKLLIHIGALIIEYLLYRNSYSYLD